MRKRNYTSQLYNGRIYKSRVLRYFFSAGAATIVDVASYFIIYNYLFYKEDIFINTQLVISAPTASLFISYLLGLITNFTLTRKIVFNKSDLRLTNQFLRYLLVAFLVLIANYYLMNFLIKVLFWYPTIARAFSAVVVGLGSFVLHKFFSFRTKKNVSL